jgi:hypothetical protein
MTPEDATYLELKYSPECTNLVGYDYINNVLTLCLRSSNVIVSYALSKCILNKNDGFNYIHINNIIYIKYTMFNGTEPTVVKIIEPTHYPYPINIDEFLEHLEQFSNHVKS